MAINKKLIRFKTLANFEKNLAEGNILNTSIVFIEDAKKIWTQGSYYSEFQVEVTYEELKNLRDTGSLIPGMKYRMTDYETIVASAPDIRTANHQFDIIIEALDEYTLSEDAQAIKHSGDEYFSNSHLEAWKIKYSIDNDTSRFSWAHVDIEEVTGKWYFNNVLVIEANSADEDVLPTEELDISGEIHTVIPLRDFECDSIVDTDYLYRSGKQYSIEEYEEFVYVGDNAPILVSEESNNSYGDYGNSTVHYYDWSEVTTINVYLHDELVTTLDSIGDGWFMDSKCPYDASFTPVPELIDGKYYYTPSYDSDWHNESAGWKGVASGEYDETVDFVLNDSCYAIYDGASTIYQIYDVSSGYTYFSYSGAIITIYHEAYSPFVEGLGKGVIYRMIDDRDNDCPYDFKNIQFLYNDAWYYTFTFNGADLSNTDYCRNNYIAGFTNIVFGDNMTSKYQQLLPSLIFDAKTNNKGTTMGVLDNRFDVFVKKGYICGVRIERTIWKSRVVGNTGFAVDNLSVVTLGAVINNKIKGVVSEFIINNSSSNDGIVDNNINLGISGCKWNITADGGFKQNTISRTSRTNPDEKNVSKIVCGSMLECNIVLLGRDFTLDSKFAISQCNIKMRNNLKINYDNTTSETTPLRFLNIDARGWDNTITIPTTFPTNSEYELNVAKNSEGEIKMWCNADLIQ